MKRALMMKQKAFFITFKELLVTKNCLRLESAPLNVVFKSLMHNVPKWADTF